MNTFDQQHKWLEQAEALKPVLKHWRVEAAYAVTPVADGNAWQGCRMEREPLRPFLEKSRFAIGDLFIVELPESSVGRLHFSLSVLSGYADSPVRLKIVFGEFPLEMINDPDTYRGSLSRAWLQDETVNIDDLPCEFSLPRRYSCRYISFQVLASPGTLIFNGIYLNAEGAEDFLPVPLFELDAGFAAIDRIGIRTLRNCLQTCFEDGPKRDRRLWTGDLRLQALVNHVSYRRYDLVERSFYLLAGCAESDGRLTGCVFERPKPYRGCYTADYTLIFSIALEEHCRWSGNYRIGNDLFDLAMRQFDFCRCHFNSDRLFVDPCDDINFWVFIDHDAELDRQAAMQGVYIASLKSLAALARRIDRRADAMRLEQEAEELTAASRKHLLDAKTGLIVSGQKRQVSCASQAWMILARVLTPEENRIALRRLYEYPGAVMPKSPYMYHYLLESYALCGEYKQLFELIRTYWGGMVRQGADTFWEAYVPGNDFFSPYHDVLMNSACHAWSCTPSYFLRRQAQNKPCPQQQRHKPAKMLVNPESGCTLKYSRQETP